MEDESDRGLFSWVGGCDKSRCASTNWLLKKNNLRDVDLVKKDWKADEDIWWYQWKNPGCGEWKWWNRWCKEQYALYTYTVEGHPDSEVLVHLATKEYPNAPNTIWTGGQDGELHMGNLIWDNEGSSVVFFVMHPNSWGPYQKRFQTSVVTKHVNGVIGRLAQAGGAALAGAMVSAVVAGATAGSVVPGPGTVAGAAIAGTGVVATAIGGYLSGIAADKYLGDYLRYIG